MSRDAVIVIGAGHDGLVAATLLARAGKKVTVLEAAERVGGRCAPIPFGAGRVAPGLLHDTSTLSPLVVKALDLGRFGLELRDPPPIFVAGDPPLMLTVSPIEGKSAAEGASPSDVEAFSKLMAFVGRVAPALRGLAQAPPPSPMGPLWPLARQGLAVRRLGRADMLELLRVAPACAGDFMKDHLEEPRLRAALALPGVVGEYLGPWSAGSAALLLLGLALRGQEVTLGPAALVEALRAAAEASGVSIRTGVEVDTITLEKGATTGVTTREGPIAASCVLATCDPKRALLKLVGPHRLPDALAIAARRLRSRGTAAKICLGLGGPLRIADREVEALRVAPSLDAIERAFDAVKYRRFAERPVLDVRIFAGEGGRVASILAHGVPAAIDEGFTAEARERLLDAVVTALDEAVTGLEVTDRQLFTPADLEVSHRLTGGQLNHLELAPDQMIFMRPTVACAGYRTPLAGFFLGGAGTHPGGLVTGLSGMHAARAILARA